MSSHHQSSKGYIMFEFIKNLFSGPNHAELENRIAHVCSNGLFALMADVSVDDEVFLRKHGYVVDTASFCEMFGEVRGKKTALIKWSQPATLTSYAGFLSAAEARTMSMAFRGIQK